MNRITLFLVLILALEVPFFGTKIYRKLSLNNPPDTDFSSIDPLTATELADIGSGVRGADDWSKLAISLLAYGYFADASQCYAQATVLEPQNANLFFEYGFCLARGGRIEDSTASFEQAVELGYENPESAWYFIGRNHLRLEDPVAAEAAFRKADKLAIAKYELAKILFRNGQLDESKKWLKEVLTEHPATMRALPLLSRIEAQLGERQRSISFSVEGAESSKRVPSPFDNEHGKIKKVFESIGYERLVKEYLRIANLHKTEEALAGFRELQSIRWTQSVNESIVKLETDLMYRNRAIDAMEDRRKRLGPNSEWLDKEAGLIWKRGDREEAVDLWRLSTRLRTGVVVKPYDALASYYREAGDEDTAVEYELAALNEGVKKYFHHQQNQKALDELLAGLKYGKDSARLQYNVAKAYRLLFNFDKAKEHYEKCLELDPTFGKAIRELEIVN